MTTVLIWVFVIALIAIVIYLWRLCVMNAEELLYMLIDKLLDKVDKDKFWESYGGQIINKLVEKVF